MTVAGLLPWQGCTTLQAPLELQVEDVQVRPPFGSIMLARNDDGTLCHRGVRHEHRTGSADGVGLRAHLRGLLLEILVFADPSDMVSAQEDYRLCRCKCISDGGCHGENDHDDSAAFMGCMPQAAVSQ